MTNGTNSRAVLSALLLAAIAVTGWLLMQAGQRGESSARQDVVFNPGYQHAHRLEIATARAAMDAIGMSEPGDNAALYRADYQRQHTQIQADSLGLDRWGAHDVRRQGLLLEVRGSLAALIIALDQETGAAVAPPGTSPMPLLAALSRTQSALSNYSASLTEPQQVQTSSTPLFSGPVLLWWLLMLLLAEVAAMAWLVFFTRLRPLSY